MLDAIILVSASLALATFLALPRLADRAAVPPAAPMGNAVGFVGERACEACHRAESRAWAGSHHAKAMQPATEATVLGDFDGAGFTHFGVTTRFFKAGGAFLVNTDGPDGRLADFPIRYTFGVDPLQQYLVELPGGRLQALTIAWDTARRRWFALYPRQRIGPDDPRHWTGRYQNWNLMCAECHTTNLRKGYDPATDTYRTTWGALGVGCEACHGPGQRHVAWARSRRADPAAPADRRTASAGGGAVPTGTRAERRGLLVDFAAADASSEVDQCARCHSRRVRLAAEERPGRPFLDEFRPERLRADLYHADGQQLEEVYEYGSFRQSAMYQRGVRCTDCHDPHTGRPRATGNGLCTRCHGERPDSRFPMLAPKLYDTPAHHHHRAGSLGAACVGCHMPAKRYMVVHARPDHAAPIPRPDLGDKLGTPDPCTTCHTGRSARWAAEVVRSWRVPVRPSSAEAIARGRSGARDATPALVALAVEPAAPAIVRATALELLGPGDPAARAALLAATRDGDPVVREAALGGLAELPPRERVTAVAPLLADPIRAVRIEAARVLAGVPGEALDAAGRRALDAALAEWKAAQMAMADMPSSHVSVGLLEASLGRRGAAEQSCLRALRMDPVWLPARTCLVALYDAAGRRADAERVLRDGIALTPGRGELHYSLGLLLVEERRLAEAAESLRQAAGLLADRPRVHYNYGLVLQRLDRRRDAETELLQAARLDGADPQIAYALAALYLRERDHARALPWAERVARLAPADARARQLVDAIRRSMPVVHER